VAGMIANACSRGRIGLPAALLLVLSPLSMVVTGHHGNTDPVLSACLLASVLAAGEGGRGAVWSGLWLGLATWVKFAAFLPGLLLAVYWLGTGWRGALRFSLVSALIAAAGWAPLLCVSGRVAEQIFGYSGALTGVWGWSWLMTWVGGVPFSGEGGSAAIVQVLKWLAVAVFVSSGIRLLRRGSSLTEAMAAGWCGLMFFAPSVGCQYLLWVQPFLVLTSFWLGLGFVISGTLWAVAYYLAGIGDGPVIATFPVAERESEWIPFALLIWGYLAVAWAVLMLRARDGTTPEPRVGPPPGQSAVLAVCLWVGLWGR